MSPSLHGPQRDHKNLIFSPSMASLSTSWFFIFTTFTILTFFPKTSLASDPPSSSSFSFKRFGGKDLTFEPNLALYGDAKVAGNGSLVQLTAGKVIYKKPIKLLQGSPRKMTSFSTYFTFSMLKPSGEPVNGLAFFMAPGNFNGSVLDSVVDNDKFRVVAVEFDTHEDGEHGGMSFVSVTGTNVSSVSYTDLVLNGGEKFQCWIDFEAASKKLEVRLSRYGESRPVDSIVSCSINLSRVLNSDGEVFVGLSSANRRSRSCYVYSWSFKVRTVPRWMHSEPLDPEVIVDDVKPVVEVHEKSDCVLRMLGSMVFGTACGALGAFVVLCLWTVFGNRRQVAPEEFSVQIADFGFDKVKVVVDNKDVGEGDGKK